MEVSVGTVEANGEDGEYLDGDAGETDGEVYRETGTRQVGRDWVSLLFAGTIVLSVLVPSFVVSRW